MLLTTWVAHASFGQDAAIEKSETGPIGGNESEWNITVGGDWAYPPFEFLDEHGEPDGFNIELLRRIAEVMNINVTIDLTNWSEARRRLETGEVDMLAGMYRTRQRQALHDFTVPHFSASYGLFVPAGSPLREFEELEGRRVIVHEGDLAHDFVENQDIDCTVVAVADWVDVIPALSEGRGDAALFGMGQGMSEVRREGYNNIEMIERPVFRQAYAMAVPKGDSELLAVLNEGLTVLKETGEFDELYEKWFGVLESRSWWDTRVARVLLAVLGLVGIAALVGAGWVVSLRMQVARQTCRLREALSESTAARTELVRANAMKSRFVATASHELRTPLHGVMGMTELLRGTSLNEYQSSLVEMMQSATGQLRRILSDLLDYSRIDSGRLSISVAPFRFAEMTGWLEPVLREMAEKEGLEFRFDCDGEDTIVEGDRERIAQIIINLVDNAVKFTQAGGLHVGVTHCREVLTVVVSDTGPGIPGDAIDGIFDPFVQLGAPEVPGNAGLGLGLPIVRSLAESMGGTITVESTVGVGSAFTVKMPLPGSGETDESVISSHPEGENEAGSQSSEGRHIEGHDLARGCLSSKVVLMAEDEAINRLVLASHLENSGATVVTASDGVQAVEAVKLQRPALVLMDVSMPIMTGTEATRRIREWEKAEGFSATPIIALTAHACNEDIARFFELGMDGYVAKPFKAAELFSEIARVCGECGNT
ncbi:MAG: transporter substrate-binding domain-containing protein [Spirochaetota bacterium]